ncbi:sensor histidine kinase [Sandaracinobacteroides saxicola]|uniref:histidine kinase n=1 Tax=Sandaracinobacteroides saxicola TaxID=2759707 RepID=A0A7G5IJ83_9SPHN|nr:ATP-binding protein [Sandaracinobacteroides saxicola]QMW23425.1 sensor N-terminal transmembrane domain-containing protein [Sandaracinobacteroides saxicola]
MSKSERRGPWPLRWTATIDRPARGVPRWTATRSLSWRILAVNLFALLGLAGGVLYLDSFRARLIEARHAELRAQTEIVAALLGGRGRIDDGLLAAVPVTRGTRIRMYDGAGGLLADNWRVAGTARFAARDPTTPGFPQKSAVAIDRAIELFTGAAVLPAYAEPAGGWPEVARAARLPLGETASAARLGDDRIVILQAAAPVMGPPPRRTVMLTAGTADLIDIVRGERATYFLIFLAVLALSLLLSGFLARTIVGPLRQLALAAHRVRLGRARDVVVPRLPGRRDEIGALARALADMTQTLRQRIDATEAFAADVAHELKNPLASLRSAVEALQTVKVREHRSQLYALIQADVRRIDRLVTDISAASRLDAELSRARLEPVDLGAMMAAMVQSITTTGTLPEGVKLKLESDGREALVAAEPGRLGQVARNLIDNALSFSPPGGVVAVHVGKRDGVVTLTVEDQGPGVPVEAREAIFERFYSERPDGEHYGQHSGLGLSIARAIVESLDGRISVGDASLVGGARFTVTLPAL